MRTMNLLMIGAVILAGSSVASAADMKCESRSAVRCPCPASLVVACEGYKDAAYVDNKQKVKTVTLTVTLKGGEKRTVTIKSPQGGIRDYYSASSNDAVKAELASAGVTLKDGDSAYLQSFVADSGIPLYTEAGPSFGTLDSVPLATRSGGGSALSAPASVALSETSRCTYADDPSLVVASACGGKKLCLGTVRCGGSEMSVACQAVGAGGNECPTADACAADPTVNFEKPARSRGGDSNSSSGGSRSGRAQ